MPTCAGASAPVEFFRAEANHQGADWFRNQFLVRSLNSLQSELA